MPKATRTDRRALAILAAILAVGAALRVTAILTVGDVPDLHGDEGYYVGAARLLASGQGYPDSFRPPAFPALLAVAFRLFGDDLTAARLAQVPFSLLTVAIAFDLVRRRFGLASATVTGLLCALHPTLVQYVHFLWSETLFTAAMLLGVWCLDRFDDTRRETWLAVAGLSLGAAALTREMLVYFLPLAAAWVWLGGRPRARRVALLLVPAALVILPWTIRNHERLGQFVLVTTNRWFPLAVGNLLPPGQILGMSRENAAFQRRFWQIPDEIEREGFARGVALDAIAGAQPWWLARKALRNGFYLFAPRSQLAKYATSGWLVPGREGLARRLVRVESAYYVIQMALGIVALWLVPGGRTKQLVIALLLLHVAVYVAANATHRFRVPLLPLIALYAGPLLCGVVARDRWRRARLGGAALTLAAFAAVVATSAVVASARDADAEGEVRGRPSGAPATASAPAPPSIVLISVDTLRADHLGAYGYARPTSPNIDALARAGVVFEQAWAPASWTLPSHATMLTGLSPFHHGAVTPARRLPADVPTLAERLRDGGWATAGIVNAPFVSRSFGFDRGFDRFEERFQRGQDPEAYHALVLEVLRSMPRQPFFLFIHFMDVHSPYRPPAGFNRFTKVPSQAALLKPRGYGFLELERRLARGETTLSREERQTLIDLYDGEILGLDAVIGELVAAIREKAPGALILLTSDHGEEFLEHGGVLHGRTLYDEVLHIPLIVAGGGVEPGRRVGQQVSLVDVVPTVLERAGAAPPHGLDGRSLAGLLGPGEARIAGGTPDATVPDLAPPPRSPSAPGAATATPQRAARIATTPARTAATPAPGADTGAANPPAAGPAAPAPGAGGEGERPIELHTRAHDESVDLRGLRTPGRKILRDQAAGRDEVFDLARDPGEKHPLPPEGEAAAAARALSQLEVRPAPGAARPDPATVEALKALGYL